jgi:hypothetical protein
MAMWTLAAHIFWCPSSLSRVYVCVCTCWAHVFMLSSCRSCCSSRTGWETWLGELFRTPLRGSPSPTSTRRWGSSRPACIVGEWEGRCWLVYLTLAWLSVEGTVQIPKAFALIRCFEAGLCLLVFSLACAGCGREGRWRLVITKRGGLCMCLWTWVGMCVCVHM